MIFYNLPSLAEESWMKNSTNTGTKHTNNLMVFPLCDSISCHSRYFFYFVLVLFSFSIRISFFFYMNESISVVRESRTTEALARDNILYTTDKWILRLAIIASRSQSWVVFLSDIFRWIGTIGCNVVIIKNFYITNTWIPMYS